MSLPTGFLDELRTRTSLTQVVGRKVMWDTRKSNQTKGDMWAPCPFHQEKTASFHVDDRKGFYYCFGCQAKGDAIGFIKDTENVSFMEAVEILAREAGMPMPERDPHAQQQANLRSDLAKVTEAAVAWFRLQLKTTGAAPARDYLARRGLDDAALDRFEIGFAPGGQDTAFQAMLAKGFSRDQVVAADIARQPDDGRAPYDAFRDRIMFPIRDARGRCIGFGGRAMADGAQAKYLNSRETDLFDKGRALYNHGPAREAAGKGQPLVVAEGYMDVIALVRAGFGATVAPLGTAITEDQLRLMWRISDEPIIALDGDTAGLRAAMRLIDLAMPLLEAGKSLRFALMPQGQDPDDLIRAKGPDAMQTLIDQAQPLVSLLWRRETEGRVFDSPERRAALDKTLREVIGRIPDASLKRHYGQALNDLRWQLFAPQRRQGGARRKGFAEMPVAALAGTRASALGSGALSSTDLRIALILATLCQCPTLIDPFTARLDRLAPRDPDQQRLTAFLQRTTARDADTLQTELVTATLAPTLAKLLSLDHVRIAPCIRTPDNLAKARQCLTEEFAKLTARRGIEHEMSEALQDLATTEEDTHLSWRLNHAIQNRQRAEHPHAPDGSDASEDTAALSRQLRDLIDRRVWEKKGR
jgi:DNA primase